MSGGKVACHQDESDEMGIVSRVGRRLSRLPEQRLQSLLRNGSLFKEQLAAIIMLLF